MNTKVAIWLVSEHTGISDVTLRKRVTESVQRDKKGKCEMQCFEFKTRNAYIVLRVQDGKYILTHKKIYSVRTNRTYTTKQLIQALGNRYGIHANEDDFVIYNSNGEDFVELYVGDKHAIVHQAPGKGYQVTIWRTIKGKAA